LDPYKKKQKQDPDECNMCEKYKGNEKRNRIRNTILREVGIQNSLTELKKRKDYNVLAI
jgi:hypothetical protein